MRFKLFRLFTALGIIVSSTFTVSCDSTARIFLRLVQFDRLQIVGLTPVKLATGQSGASEWRPACGGDATHVRLAVNLKSTARQNDEGESIEKDLQIRPGEDAIGKSTVKLGETISAGNFQLNLDCISKHDGTTAGGACTGTSKPSAGVSELEFVDHLNGKGRGTPVGVAFVIDQSGSIDGLVDGSKWQIANSGGTPSNSPGASCLEGADGTYDFPTDLTECASDSSDLRIAAVKSFLDLLNEDDPTIAFAFNEVIGVDIVCNVPGLAQPSNEEKGERCYTTDRPLLKGGDGLPSALDNLKGDGAGRSNLWNGVKTAFEYLQTANQESRHVVVITDGPDTCDPASDTYQHCFDFSSQNPSEQAQSPCAKSKKYSEARSAVQAYLDQGNRDMHVSFIHFQSKGYPDQDPRMQEIACMTGGHYIFINNNQIASNSDTRKDAILEAVARIRYTFGGYWGLITDVPDFTNTTGGGTSVAAGAGYAFNGTMILEPTDVANKEIITQFAWGDNNLDERLPLAKPCSADPDCGAGAGGAECGTRCDSDARICTAPRAGTACTGGVCCNGACAAGGVLCTDMNPADLPSPPNCP